MKTIIYTSFPCLVSCDDKEEQLNENEHLILDNTPQKLWIYPTGRGRYAFEVNIKNTNNPFYRIVERENKLLIFLLSGLYAENVNCFKYNYNGKNSEIEVSSNKIIFKGLNNKKILHLKGNIENIKCGNFMFINYCSFSYPDGQKELIAYNTKNGNAKIFEGEDVVIDNDGFSVTSSLYGYEKITESYYVDKEGLKVKSKNFISSQAISPSQTLPYKFMNAIKCGDYDGANNMLSTDLSSSLSEETLKDYFGRISYFYMLSPDSCFAISDDKNVVYEFTIKNNKISEISDS